MILKIISINNLTDYYKLTDVIPRDYLSPNLIDLFQKRLNSSIKSIVVEYPYVDKDYRSTYYNFYSKRHRNYDKFCFRLHFFEKPFESKDDLPKNKDKKCLFRVYMTSSRSYKRELRKSKLMNPSMQSAQLELPMPKFIWVVEIASLTNYDKLLTDYRWIIDATANHYERYPFLSIHDRNKMIIHDRALEGKLYRILFDSPVQPYELYQNNLRRYT